MSPRSVVIISAVNPYPTDSGKKVMLSGFVEYWRERVGPEDTHYILVRPERELRGPAPVGFPVQLHRLASPAARHQVRALLTRTLTARASMQEAMLDGPRLQAELGALLAEIGADLEIFDTVRLGQYAERIPQRAGSRRVIYLDDLFSERYAAMIRAGDEFGDVSIDALGAFAAMVPGPLRRPVDHPLVQRSLLRAESRLIGRAERAATRQFSRCLLVNAGEAETLMAQTGADNVSATPPLVTVSAETERRFDGRPDFIFLGLLSLPHNDDGIRCFLEQGMPRLLELRPDARVRIVGREATPALKQLAKRFEGSVVMEGFVPDLDDLLSRAAALLTPLRFGSGVKIKLIESLARGLPVVSTSFGGDGIVDDVDQGVVAVENLRDFPTAMVDLLDGERNALLSRQARERFQQVYARDVVFQAYDRAFSVDHDGFPDGAGVDRLPLIN